MLTDKKPIEILARLIRDLQDRLVIARTWLNSAETQAKFIETIKRLDIVSRVQQARLFCSKFVLWVTAEQGFRTNKPAMIFACLLVVFMISLFDSDFDLADLKESGELLVVSRESDTTW